MKFDVPVSDRFLRSSLWILIASFRGKGMGRIMLSLLQINQSIYSDNLYNSRSQEMRNRC